MLYIVTKNNTDNIGLYNLCYNNNNSLQEEYINDFEQPTLTENGVLGGDSFAVWASSTYPSHTSNPTKYDYRAFKAVDGTISETNFWHSFKGVKNSGFPADYIIYNPEPLSVTRLEIYCPRDYEYWLKSYKIYASNDNIYYREVCSGTTGNSFATKFTIDISEVGYFKYWKIQALSSGGDRTDEIAFSEIKITATKYTGKLYSGDCLMFKGKNDK